MKSLSILIVGIIAGYLLTNFFQTPGVIRIVDTVEVVKTVEVCSETESLDENECLGNKNDLSQSFLMFLAGIGVRLNTTQLEELGRITKLPMGETAQSGAIREVEIKTLVEPPLDPATVLANSEREYETENKEVISKNGSLKDPAIFKARSRVIKAMNKTMRRANGEFIGKLNTINKQGTPEIHDIELSIDYRQDGEDLTEGSFVMRMSHNGEVYSNNRGSGKNNALRLNQGRLIIEASPNTFFLIRGKSIVGVAEYYQDNRFVGKAIFKRLR